MPLTSDQFENIIKEVIDSDRKRHPGFRVGSLRKNSIRARFKSAKNLLKRLRVYLSQVGKKDDIGGAPHSSDRKSRVLRWIAAVEMG